MGIFLGLHAHSQNIKIMTGSMFFVLAGVFFFYVVVRAFGSGGITIKRSFYERAANPVEFWFYLFLFSLIGMFGFGTGISILWSALKTQ